MVLRWLWEIPARKEHRWWCRVRGSRNQIYQKNQCGIFTQHRNLTQYLLPSRGCYKSHWLLIKLTARSGKMVRIEALIIIYRGPDSQWCPMDDGDPRNIGDSGNLGRTAFDGDSRETWGGIDYSTEASSYSKYFSKYLRIIGNWDHPLLRPIID